MITLERAKRFHKAIQRRWLETWDVSVGIGYTLKINLLGREARAARALIKSDYESIAKEDIGFDGFHAGYRHGERDGLRHALQILDAVYGREGK